VKLFVDDVRNRPEGWYIARTVTDAIRILASMPVKEVSLDHDIAFQGRHGAELETFEGVAWYIAGMAIDKRPVIVYIHTANMLAAARMAQILSDAGINAVIRSVDESLPEREI